LGAPQSAARKPEELLLERSLLLRGGDVDLLAFYRDVAQRTRHVVGTKLCLLGKLLSKIRLLLLA